MIPTYVLHCGFGLLVAGLAIPLALEWVPMNRIYGVRIPKAFISERHWFAINAFGGKLLLVYGALLTAFGYLARSSAPSVTSPWSSLFIAGPLVLVFPFLLAIGSYARRLPDR